MNKSGLKPLGHAVLTEPYEVAKMSSIIEIPDAAKARLGMIENRVTVVEIGPEAWKKEAAPRAKPGDRVMISKFAGIMVKGTADGKDYRMVNADDIYCGIIEEASTNG